MAGPFSSAAPCAADFAFELAELLVELTAERARHPALLIESSGQICSRRSSDERWSSGWLIRELVSFQVRISLTLNNSIAWIPLAQLRFW